MVKFTAGVLSILICASFSFSTIVYQSEERVTLLNVTERNENSVTIEFNLSQLRASEDLIREFGNGVRLHIDDKLAVPAEIGTPDVSRIKVMIQIPDRGGIALSVLETQSEILGNYTVLPYQRPPRISGEAFPYAIDEKVYATDAFFPNTSAQVISCEILRDIRVARVFINPVQVNPVTGSVKVISKVTFKLSFTPSAGENELFIRDKSASRSFVPMYKDILNIDPRFLNARTRQDNVPCYVFLGNDQTLAAVQDFINWKIRKGLQVHVANVDTVGSTYDVIDAWIEKIYSEWSPKPEYIFFIGGEDVIPPHISSDYECDNKFGVIGSGTTPSIHFGRITAKSNSMSNLTYQVWRTRKYEMEPLDGTWLSRADAFGCTDNTGPQAAAKMVSTFESAGLTAKSYVEGTSSLITGQALLDVFNEGLALFSMTGHGFQTTWATAKIKTTDIPKLTNGMKLSFITNVACLNSNFRGRYCFAESWMCEGSESDPKGCIAQVSSAPSATTGALPMLQGIMDGICKEGIRSGGAALTYGKTLCNSSFNIHGFIFWGCPETEINATPDGLTELVAQHQPPKPGAFGISVSDGANPVEGALVSVVTTGYEPLGSGYTNSSGELTLTLPQFRDSTYVTVTLYNCKPYLATCRPAGSFLIDLPEPNALFDVNEKITIQWQTDGDPVDKVKIEYTIDNGQAFSTIESSIDNTGSYEWTTPKDVGSDECFIKLTDVSNLDEHSTSSLFRIWDISDVSGMLSGGEPAEIHYNGAITGFLSVAAQGDYTLEKLYPGDYKIFALAGIYSSDTVSLKLPPDTSGIDLEIKSPMIALDPEVLNLKVDPESTKDFEVEVDNSGKLALTVNAKSNNASRTVVINEVFAPKSAFIDGIELWNRGPDIAVDGWKVVWKDSDQTSGEYAFASGFTFKSGETVVIMDDESSVNSTTFYMGVNAGWSWEDGTEMSVALLDDQGKGVDFIRTKGNTDEPPAGTVWSGDGVSLKSDRIYRTGNGDSDNANDWSAANGEESINVINPGQSNGQMPPLWMSLASLPLTVDAVSTKPFTLSVDTKGLAKGKYYDTLIVYHNAANKLSPFNVACELEVKELSYPVAVAKTASTDQEVAVVITLEGSDSDGSITGYKVVDDPAHGSVEIGGDKATYTPEKGFFGDDTFNYVAIDDDGLESEKAGVSIKVNKVTEIIATGIVKTAAELSAVPNPVDIALHSAVNFSVNVKGITHVKLVIYDQLGNVIDKYEDNTPDNSYQWDLTNRQGRKVAGGVYLAVFQVTDDEGTVHSSSVRVGVIGQ